MTRRIVVMHAHYGCDTGCCGHVIEMTDADNPALNYHQFRFTHPNDDNLRAWAEELVRDELGDDHVADLAWDECVVYDD